MPSIAIAWAFAQDNILQELWLLARIFVLPWDRYTSPYGSLHGLLINYRTFWTILPGFFSAAIAVIAWHFRKEIKS